MLRASSICLWLGAFVFESGVFCQTYVVIIGPSAPKYTIPTGINEQNEIEGYLLDGSDIPHGFVRAADGTITSFDPPDSRPFRNSMAQSINDDGAITGYYQGLPFPFTTHGFVRDPEGNFTTFDPPGSISTNPLSIRPKAPSPAITTNRIC